MKEGMTELVFILDRSGSMFGLEKDTIGGFNSMIQKQNPDPWHCEPVHAEKNLFFLNQSSSLAFMFVIIAFAKLVTNADESALNVSETFSASMVYF